MTRPTPHYETVGDVRRAVDEAFAPQAIHSSGGMLYPFAQSIIFGLVDDRERRVGDAYCSLPDGWSAESYVPQSHDKHNGISFTVIRGVGELILPPRTHYRMTDGREVRRRLDSGGRRPFHIVNRGDELLIVHARSLLYPMHHTNLAAAGNQRLHDLQPMHTSRTFTYEQAYGQSNDSGPDSRLA